MAAPIYRGFSSTREDTVATEVYDIELVKIDLMNHFNTRLGERVRRQKHGSIIWDLFGNLFDERTESAVRADVERIINSDPRVRLHNMKVDIRPDEHSITVSLNLYYVEFDMTEWIDFTFRERNR